MECGSCSTAAPNANSSSRGKNKMTGEMVALGANLAIGGINLVFILKILYNHLERIEKKLDKHIHWHLDHPNPGEGVETT